ncbi:Smg-4/UPF3 family-domain-containing protein [Neohortaea acidophila]|uniref:Smg-4/UPF3 family-domain-containing protein n=1 Tax=Neohortaea acidophila TaxID=245834 RepID=A0A6A6PSL7_9PEZI|nr:Smg-4/UPF3 family-domain-containing protein [Neohortaea acidophila]KAF2482972.1 Smg-4/UPF3 family-domain-containing protein [Neohortaea acidophila]
MHARESSPCSPDIARQPIGRRLRRPNRAGRFTSGSAHLANPKLLTLATASIFDDTFQQKVATTTPTPPPAPAVNMPPKIVAKPADRTGGVLPVNAAARAKANRAPAIRLKLEVRRLPPGLTLVEFEEILGEEWKLGNGKVDWREYRQGKLRPAGSGKVLEQSRCYLHVVNEACVKEFETRFLDVAFQDKAGTWKSAELKNLSPALGFAPNQRTPLQHPKQKADVRQGTIDQDPDFMLFLEAETQPIVKPPSLDTVGLEKAGEKKEIKTTPLIEDLRERKANKARAAQAKAEKDRKGAKGKESAGKDGGKDGQQGKVEQAAKDAVKVLNKQAGKQQQQQTPQGKGASPTKGRKAAAMATKQQQATSSQATPAAPASASPRTGPNTRQRGNAEGIKKMLQKDLGIKPKPSQTQSPTSATSATPASATTQTGPTTSTAASTSTPTPSDSKQQPQQPTQPQTKAYLKHANPSQGMTEMLIQQALSNAFGEVLSVTIDPRKGTAIATFKSPEGLKKALEAKHVPVAGGAVEVLEFRDRGGAAGSGGRWKCTLIHSAMIGRARATKLWSCEKVETRTSHLSTSFSFQPRLFLSMHDLMGSRDIMAEHDAVEGHDSNKDCDSNKDRDSDKGHDSTESSPVTRKKQHRAGRKKKTLKKWMQSLPQELFDKIYDLTFKLPAPGVREIDEEYTPPVMLQISTETRDAFAKAYYGNGSQFRVKQAIAKKWLTSLLHRPTDLTLILKLVVRLPESLIPSSWYSSTALHWGVLEFCTGKGWEEFLQEVARTGEEEDLI